MTRFCTRVSARIHRLAAIPRPGRVPHTRACSRPASKTQAARAKERGGLLSSFGNIGLIACSLFLLCQTTGGNSLADDPSRLPVPHVRDGFDQRPQPWQRRDSPVLSAYTTRQTWCKVVLYSPHVLHHAGTFRMWYLGTSTASRSNDMAVGYAESADGISWTEHRGNPILTAADVPWGRIWQTPFVLFDDDEGVFKMWFVSGNGVRRDDRGRVLENDQRLGYATSQDGKSWNVHPRPIYASGRSPSVIKQSADRYRMWMNSRPNLDNVSGELYTNIYEFRSSDGLHWIREARPCVRPSGKSRSTVYPFVVHHENRFHMWYGCHVDRRFEIFHASSANGSQWSINHSDPAFPARSGQRFFDARYTSTPCVVSLPDRYFLYYSARDMKTTYIDGQGRQQKDSSGIYAHIGVAVMRKPSAR